MLEFWHSKNNVIQKLKITKFGREASIIQFEVETTQLCVANIKSSLFHQIAMRR